MEDKLQIKFEKSNQFPLICSINEANFIFFLLNEYD